MDAPLRPGALIRPGGADFADRAGGGDRYRSCPRVGILSWTEGRGGCVSACLRGRVNGRKEGRSHGSLDPGEGASKKGKPLQPGRARRPCAPEVLNFEDYFRVRTGGGEPSRSSLARHGRLVGGVPGSPGP